jgi:hypothetical protein
VRGIDGCPQGEGLKAVGNQAMGCIVGRYADLNAVANHHLDPVFFHSAGQNTSHRDVIFTVNFHGTTAKDLGNDAFQLN